MYEYQIGPIFSHCSRFSIIGTGHCVRVCARSTLALLKSERTWLRPLGEVRAFISCIMLGSSVLCATQILSYLRKLSEHLWSSTNRTVRVFVYRGTSNWIFLQWRLHGGTDFFGLYINTGRNPFDLISKQSWQKEIHDIRKCL